MDETFLDTVRRLHDQAGKPSTRAISELSNGEISHSTAHTTLAGINYPRWRVAKILITALGGDPDEYQTLWLKDSLQPQPGRAVRAEARTTQQERSTAAIDRLATAIDRLATAIESSSRRASP